MRELHLSSQRIPVELASCSQLTALTLLLGNVPEHQIECVSRRAEAALEGQSISMAVHFCRLHDAEFS